MRKMKTWMVTLGLCLLMTACSDAMTEMENTETTVRTEETTVENSEGNNTEFEIEDEKFLWSEKVMWNEVEFLEKHFGDGRKYKTMDKDLAISYGAAIRDSYDFIGRVAEDGFGYVLGFKKGEKDPFEGYSYCWRDGEFTVERVNETTFEETTMFTLSDIENFMNGENNTVLYLQPKDMEEPENISIAFGHKYCNGESGCAYLESVVENEIRFTPPDSGAYLEIYRFDNGKRRWEYLPLTEEEEKKIKMSDALIFPDWYGHIGLKVIVSEETYEETGKEAWAVTDEALRIAEERCDFVAMDISEIHDIKEAKLEMNVRDESEGKKKIEIFVTEEDVLKELEEIYAGAEVAYEGKCPYTGILTLTREDGKELTLQLATDSCDGFVYGSCGFYSVGKEKTDRVWEIFSEARLYTGW